MPSEASLGQVPGAKPGLHNRFVSKFRPYTGQCTVGCSQIALWRRVEQPVLLWSCLHTVALQYHLDHAVRKLSGNLKPQANQIEQLAGIHCGCGGPDTLRVVFDPLETKTDLHLGKCPGPISQHLKQRME